MRRTVPRESKETKAATLERGDMRVNREDRRVYISGKEINLTSKEFEVLELLMSNPTVDVHVRRLREKIESSPSEPKYVQTKWGTGYYFKE